MMDPASRPLSSRDDDDDDDGDDAGQLVLFRGGRLSSLERLPVRAAPSPPGRLSSAASEALLNGMALRSRFMSTLAKGRHRAPQANAPREARRRSAAGRSDRRGHAAFLAYRRR